MGQKSRLGVEERVEAVLALLRKEEPAASLSRRDQVSEQTLSRGKKEAVAATRRIEKLEKELGRRAQVIGELTIAHGIFKKLQESPL